MPDLSTISRWYDPLDLKPEDVNEKDLATSLSHICRFNGHIEPFYSVAQHSISVARLVEARGASPTSVVQALLHDASEAYLCGDIPGPLKPYILLDGPLQMECTGIGGVEWWMRKVIHRALGCLSPTWKDEEVVHQADRDMLLVEFLHLKPKHLHARIMNYGSIPADAIRVGLCMKKATFFYVRDYFLSELDRLRAACR